MLVGGEAVTQLLAWMRTWGCDDLRITWSAMRRRSSTSTARLVTDSCTGTRAPGRCADGRRTERGRVARGRRGPALTCTRDPPSALLRRMGPVPVLTAPANAHWARSTRSGMGLGPEQWFGSRAGSTCGSRPRCTATGRCAPAQRRDRPLVKGTAVRCGSLGTPSSSRDWPGSPDARRRVDVALVPVHGWGPPLGRSPRAGRGGAACAMSVRFAVPIHWGAHAPAGQHLRPAGWTGRVPRSQPRCSERLPGAGGRPRAEPGPPGRDLARDTPHLGWIERVYE